jgi:hypothetical protein
MSTPELQALPKPAYKKNRLFAAVAISIAAAAVAVGAGGGFGFFARFGGDSVSSQQLSEITGKFNGFNGPLIVVDMSDPEQKAKAEKSLDLPEAQAKQVMAEASSGSLRLCWLTLWDNFSEDGDVVRVTAGGYSRALQIWNMPITIAFPLPLGTPVQLTGVRDGGGGITVAIATANGEFPVPPLLPGQTVTLPVR